MLDDSNLNIHQVTFRDQWSFRESIEGMARHGVYATAVWREKLHEIGVDEAARILRDNGMSVSAICPVGLVAAPGENGFQAGLDDNRWAIEEAVAIGAPCLVFISGGLPEGSRDLEGARAQTLETLAALVPEARAAGIKLGIEPLHPMICDFRAVLCTLEQANDWCDQLDADDTLGVVVDTYHIWWDPNVAREITRAGERICAFHINDWLEDTEDLRLDRGMMGDGVIDIPGIRKMVETAGYNGPPEVEIFSAKNWWRRDPGEVIEVIKERYREFV